MGFAKELLCALAVVVQDAHSHPPVARGAIEVQDFGGTIFASQVVGQVSSCVLVGE